MKTEKIKTVSGNDLLKMDLPDLKFPVEGFLPQGLHILSGLPKAGKSWMLLLLCLRVSEGKPFWLYQTNRGTVLYLCLEDSFNRIQQRLGITFIYVTHDQEEALSMSDKVIVMDGGEIQHIGTPEDIYNEPANAFVADFIGESNILDGIMLSD